MRVLSILIYAIGAFGLEDYLYAVNFGFREITSARIGDHNNIIPVAKVDGSKEYQARMKELSVISKRPKAYTPWLDEPHSYTQQDQEIFTAALSQILEASAELGHPMNISTVTFPSDIEMCTNERHHLRRFFLDSPLVPLIDLQAQVIESRAAARTVYDLNTYGGFGCPNKGDRWCDWNIALFIDYSFDFLNLTVADMDEIIVDVLDEPFGRLEWSRSGRVKESEVYGAMENFISEFSDSDIEEYLLAIIVTGEASNEVMYGLRKNLRRILPMKWQGLIRDQIDPRFVAAFGGAYEARKFPGWNIMACYDEPTDHNFHFELDHYA
ncbi:hypothetical protein N7456_011165 [Penicillium angulare]|uniref:Uncharacterized protein n=1 Tax=Penicillium angulare TaxID=116970 RepID=A0A9W9ETE5_9EURO|nr:hypothetical protein N7456_011165 [Penicillium angulare]